MSFHKKSDEDLRRDKKKMVFIILAKHPDSPRYPASAFRCARSRFGASIDHPGWPQPHLSTRLRFVIFSLLVERGGQQQGGEYNAKLRVQMHPSLLRACVGWEDTEESRIEKNDLVSRKNDAKRSLHRHRVAAKVVNPMRIQTNRFYHKIDCNLLPNIYSQVPLPGAVDEENKGLFRPYSTYFRTYIVESSFVPQ